MTSRLPTRGFHFSLPALFPASISAPQILGLNAAKTYGIDVEATRCAIESTKLAQHKRNLDGEFGERRWAFTKPLLTSRREFWRLHRMNGFRPG